MQVATTPHSQAVSHEAPSCKPAEHIIEMGETRGMQGDVLMCSGSCLCTCSLGNNV